MSYRDDWMQVGKLGKKSKAKGRVHRVLALLTFCYFVAYV